MAGIFVCSKWRFNRPYGCLQTVIGHESCTLPNEISDPILEKSLTHCSSLSPLCASALLPSEDVATKYHLMGKKQVLPDIEASATLILDFLLFRTIKNKWLPSILLQKPKPTRAKQWAQAIFLLLLKIPLPHSSN